FGDDYAPLRIDGGEGVLLSDSANLLVQRTDGTTGEVRWRTAMDEPFSEPIAGRNSLFVATQSGRLARLDTQSGDVNWVVQIPQELRIGPGLEKKGTANRLYQTGDHSNLYVLNARDGSCVESYYLGHAEGTIAVPPVPLLGHLFVIENATPDRANVHVLKMDDQGQSLEVAQPPFPILGNVVVPPKLQDRRLVVLSDRGQVTVYDVEPTATTKQVSVMATLPPSYESSTPTEMALGRGQMWITGTRISRYELQISTGRVVRDWVDHEADTFIGEPLATQDALVHARILRGTSAIRVTASDPKTGVEIWHNDVGVPVSMVMRVPDKPAFHVATSQGALVEIDRDSLETGSTRGPIENPGGRGVESRFESPIAVSPQVRVLLNQSQPDLSLVYNPERSREKLRKVQLLYPGGSPAGEVIASAGGLLVPLDNGRMVLMNYRTGTVMGSPFQPASDPVGTVRWSTPVPLPDDPDQVVVGDSRKKLYRVRVGQQMRSLASVDIKEPLLGAASGVGNSYIATASGPASDFLLGYDLASLQPTFRKLLSGRVDYGPVSVGDYCLVRTDDGVLHAFDESGEQRFRLDAPEGEIVDKPITMNGRLLLAGRPGWLIAIDAATGELSASKDLGQPISASPLPIGNRLLVPGFEGLIFIVQL
ncbi:MAG: PQQ-binding-like beta-propeller repeat protein, partial [Planctomycetota bacterium]